MVSSCSNQSIVAALTTPAARSVCCEAVYRESETPTTASAAAVVPARPIRRNNYSHEHCSIAHRVTDVYGLMNELFVSDFRAVTARLCPPSFYWKFKQQYRPVIRHTLVVAQSASVLPRNKLTHWTETIRVHRVFANLYQQNRSGSGCDRKGERTSNEIDLCDPGSAPPLTAFTPNTDR